MNTHKATVMNFDGNSWINVGNPEFSKGAIFCPWLAFSPRDGEPYLVFVSDLDGLKGSLMRFNDTNWVYVGDTCFTTFAIKQTNLAFNATDSLPYVVFTDYWNYQQTNVMKFNGNNWVNVGNQSFSSGKANDPTLAFSTTGIPYVGFGDEGSYYNATVMKYDGSNWVDVGNPGFSEGGKIWVTSLVMGPENVPYIAYKECPTDSCDMSVMKYDSVFVGLNKENSKQFVIYPNPTSSVLNISLSGVPTQVDNYNIEILDTKGINFYKDIGSKKNQIDVHSFPSGVYFVRLRSGDSIIVKKFCKN